MTQRPVTVEGKIGIVPLPYTPGSAVLMGAIVIRGNLVTLANCPLAANELGVTWIGGLWKVPKITGGLSDGDDVYWNPTGSPVNWTATSGAAQAAATAYLMGTVIGDAAADDEFCYVLARTSINIATAAGALLAASMAATDSSLDINGKAGIGAGTAGSVSVKGGDSAGPTGTAGRLVLDAGAATGGTADYVDLAPTNASKVKIGKPIDLKVGASTAAAGVDNTDCTALPAGTGSTYPVTAADNAKGVILNVADQVTGRTIFIANLVSNKILKVYPPTGGTINGAAANVAFSSASGGGVIVACVDGATNAWAAW